MCLLCLKVNSNVVSDTFVTYNKWVQIDMSQEYTYIEADGTWFSNNDRQSNCLIVCMSGYFVCLFIIFIFIFLSFLVNIKYLIFLIIQSNVIDYYYQIEISMYWKVINYLVVIHYFFITSTQLDLHTHQFEKYNMATAEPKNNKNARAQHTRAGPPQ